MPKTKHYWLRGAIIGFVFALIVVGLSMASSVMSDCDPAITEICVHRPSFAYIFFERVLSYIGSINGHLDFIHPIVCKLYSCGGWIDLTGLYTIWPSYILLGIAGGSIYKKIKHRRTTGKWS